MKEKRGYKFIGENVNMYVGKITNSRNGGTSGTLKLMLIKMSYFYDGGPTINANSYDLVA